MEVDGRVGICRVLRSRILGTAHDDFLLLWIFFLIGLDMNDLLIAYSGYLLFGMELFLIVGYTHTMCFHVTIDGNTMPRNQASANLTPVVLDDIAAVVGEVFGSPLMPALPVFCEGILMRKGFVFALDILWAVELTAAPPVIQGRSSLC